MCPLPDDFSSARYANAYERPIIAVEPPLYAATFADVAAMQIARAQIVASLESLRAHPWEYDSTEIPPHDYLVADAQAFLEQFDKAITQARASMEGWS